MTYTPKTNAIDYIEIYTNDIEMNKNFFGELFGWKFTDYGPKYLSFTDGRLEGGFEYSDNLSQGTNVLVIFYSDQLEKMLTKVKSLKATITKDIYSFPGGRRFEFELKDGNRFAIWSH